MTVIIDSDQHLYESRTMWAEHIDPSLRHEALAIVDDELGYPWLTWRGRRLDVADVQIPGDTAVLGRHRQRLRERLAPEYHYDEQLPAHYWDPSARASHLDVMGLDEAVVFPNFGLFWERRLSESLPALTANMAREPLVRNRRGPGQRPIAPGGAPDPARPGLVGGPTGRPLVGGVRLAMIAPAAVDGRPLSHPDLDDLWAAFVHHGVTPVFHVADQPRVLDEAFYTDPDDSFVPVIESIFLWVQPALAVPT